MTDMTATRQLYEVNLYCEVACPEHLTPQERVEIGLCDWNLIFSTQLGEGASTDDFLKDAKARFPEEMKEFFDELADGSEFSVEWHVPYEDNIYETAWDELLFQENKAPFSCMEQD